MARDFWSKLLIDQQLRVVMKCLLVLASSRQSTGVLETFWRRLDPAVSRLGKLQDPMEGNRNNRQEHGFSPTEKTAILHRSN